jgi:hypothetical protein
MSNKEDHDKELQAQFDVTSANINKLKAIAVEAVADAQLRYYKQIGDLRNLQNVAKKRISQLGEDREDA